MNERQPEPAMKRPYSGRGLLFLGLLLLVAGPVINGVLMGSKVLIAPWYVPILATLGVLLIAWSLALRHTFWRWSAAGLATLFAAFAWLMMLVLLAAPPYRGSVTAGQAFPSFETRLASGEPFQQGDLRGDRNTILLFFRGRW